MMSRNGVFYGNLVKSTYYYEIDDYKFYFTSKLHLSKFIHRIDTYNLELRETLSKKLKSDIFVDDLFTAFMLYPKIETRGFCISKGDEEVWRTMESVKISGKIGINRLTQE